MQELLQRNRIVFKQKPPKKAFHKLAGGRTFGIIDWQEHDNGLVLVKGCALSEAGFRRLYGQGAVIFEILRSPKQAKRLGQSGDAEKV